MRSKLTLKKIDKLFFLFWREPDTKTDEQKDKKKGKERKE